MREELDADAVARVRRGERAAFAELYDRYAKLVRCICYDGAGNLNDAHDLCQDVFLKAYRNIRELRDPKRFAYWLTEITRNAVRDWQRGRSRDLLRTGPPIADVDIACKESGEASELRDAIRELPEDERTAMHLFYLDQEPAVVARQILGLSQSAFYKLLDKARRNVAEAMKETQENNHG